MEHVPIEPVPPVKAHRVGRLKPAHARYRIWLGYFDHQMIVVGHQDEGMYKPTGALAHLPQRGQKLRARGLITENRFPLVATIQQMINGAGELDACFPRHEPGQVTRALAAPSSQNAEILRLTPSAPHVTCFVPCQLTRM